MMGEARVEVLRCRCETQPGEVVAVTGSSPDLGDWRKGSVLPLVQDSQDRDLWQLSVSLASGQVHQYRYCVVVILQVSLNQHISTSVNTDIFHSRYFPATPGGS